MKSSKSKITKKSTLKSSSSLAGFNRGIVAAFAVIFAAIGTYLVLQTSAAPKNQPAVTLSLSPSSSTLRVGETLSLAVKLNTNGQAVNAVEAVVSYPSDRFEFVNVDSTGSAFTIEAPVSTSSGLITIPRGTTGSVNSSDALVATVNLRATTTGRKIQVRLLETSQVLRTSDSLNILERRTNGQYTIR